MIIGYLRGGIGNYLRSDKSPSVEGFLYAHLGPATTGYLRPYGRIIESVVTASFPKQFSGLRYWLGSMKELALVALAEGNSGNQLRIHKGGTTYCVYLVPTSDPNASQIRIDTSGGVMSARLKT